MRTALALAVLCVAAPALAQAPVTANGPAQLRVTVLDQTSAGIPGAVVTVTVPGGAAVKAVADERGVATIPGLPAAGAQVHVEAAGFVARDAPLTLRRGTNTQTVTLTIEGKSSSTIRQQPRRPGAPAQPTCSTRVSSNNCRTTPMNSRPCWNRWRAVSARSSA
jgi:carboxypeptidase family protein